VTSREAVSPWINGFTLALTEAEHRLVQTILVGDEHELFGTIGDQPITRKDIRTLRGLTWLNDEVRSSMKQYLRDTMTIIQGC
jgi:Ulp1 family protease